VQTLSGAHRFILDYLTEEALKTQPPDVQDFLLETAILPRLSGGLCDAVTVRSDSAALLERLLAANLFIIPLDDEGRWYRYHHLFAELLQHKLRREHNGRLPELHRRASLWHEGQDMPAASIEHALAAGDERRVVTLLEKYGWRLLTREHSPMLLQWMQALPEALRNSAPRLNTGLVWGKILHGEYQQAAPYLAAAQTALENLPPEAAETRALQAEILALRSFMALAQGQVAEALPLAEKARALAPGDNARLVGSTALALGVACRVAGRFDEAIVSLEEAFSAAQMIDDHVTAMVAVVHLSLIWIPLGRLRRLMEKAEFAIERAEIISQVAPLMIGTVHAVIGQVYYEWNQVEKAHEMLLHGLRMAQLSGQPTSVIYVSISLARLCQRERRSGSGGSLPARSG
jgi:LuxR family transcriptional regulator, maltose regulon positive regulatory protein